MSEISSISIITPVFNREDCILRCLDSVAAQYEWIDRHIIVDDGSSDRTAELVEEYCRTHDKVYFYRMPENRGTNAARNMGITHVESRFTMILDSDDTLNEGAMRKIHEIISCYPKYGHYMFAASDMVPIYERTPLLRGRETTELTFVDALGRRFTGDFIHVILTATMKKFPFDEKTRIFEGVSFLRFYREAGRILYCNSVAVNRDRDRDDSVTFSAALTSKEALARAWRAVKLRYEFFRDDYEKYELRSILEKELKVLCMLSVALGERKFFRSICGQLTSRCLKFVLQIISACHCGMLLRWLIILQYRFFVRRRND